MLRHGCLAVMIAMLSCDSGQLESARADTESHSEGSAPAAEALRALINAARARGGSCGRRGARPPAPPLLPSSTLAVTADQHARDMVAHGYLAHRDLQGSRAEDRARRAGYLGDVGENIAWQAPDAAAALAAWMASPDHCANLLDARFQHTGVGIAESPSLGVVWVETFGAPARSVR